MKLTSKGIENGYWADRFGKHGDRADMAGDKNIRSVPFTIEDAPAGTVSFAAVLDDKDSIPVCGFAWIHWTLCNLTSSDVAENASQNHPDFVQGTTSFCSCASDETREQASCYGGMAPPDKDHEYDLQVYALDCMLDLEDGFYLGDLLRAMRGHVLAHRKISAWYRV